MDLKNNDVLLRMKEQMVQDIKVEVKDIDVNRQIKQVRVEINTNDENLHNNIDKGVVIDRINYNRQERKQIEVKYGDIYWARLDGGVEGSEQGGIRPVINIQNPVGSKHSPTIIVAIITTSMTKAKLPTHEEISGYGLPKDSVVLLEQIRTIDKSRLKGYIGHVDEIKMKKIDRAKNISTSNYKQKNTLERLPVEIQKYLINNLKMIDTYMVTIETMKINNVPVNAIDLIEDRKFMEENGLRCYCDKNRINYDIVYNNYIEIIKEKEESIAL